MLKDKKIVLGVTGSIAAYKSVQLVRALKKLGADVHVIMTNNANEFVAPLTLKTLSENYVRCDMFNDPGSEIAHINLQDEADIFVVAPATANIIGKFASGIADDFLSTFFLAVKAPVLIAPAMNCNMYLHPIVQDNISKLASHGVSFVGPESGELACKKDAIGRMSEIDDILESIQDTLTKKTLEGKRVLVTAGPTVEAVDPVRFISNRSSGKMGYAIAKMAKRRGASVTLISGPVTIKPPPDVSVINVKSAAEMHDAVKDNYTNCDILVMAAACADFTVENYSNEKIKKGNKSDVTLKLTRTVDILKDITQEKGDKVVIGFAAESENITENALVKLREKNLNFIVANDIKNPDAGFEVDTNVASIIDTNETVIHYDIMTKDDLAEEIMDKIASLLTI